MRVYSWFTSLKWWFYKAIYEFLVARAISQERLAFYNKWRLRELGPGGRARGWEVDVFSLWLWRWFQLIYSHLDPEFTYWSIPPLVFLIRTFADLLWLIGGLGSWLKVWNMDCSTQRKTATVEQMNSQKCCVFHMFLVLFFIVRSLQILDILDDGCYIFLHKKNIIGLLYHNIS